MITGFYEASSRNIKRPAHASIAHQMKALRKEEIPSAAFGVVKVV